MTCSNDNVFFEERSWLVSVWFDRHVWVLIISDKESDERGRGSSAMCNSCPRAAHFMIGRYLVQL